MPTLYSKTKVNNMRVMYIKATKVTSARLVEVAVHYRHNFRGYNKTFTLPLNDVMEDGVARVLENYIHHGCYSGLVLLCAQNVVQHLDEAKTVKGV